MPLDGPAITTVAIIVPYDGSQAHLNPIPVDNIPMTMWAFHIYETTFKTRNHLCAASPLNLAPARYLQL
jgi:hypothetical protein